MVSHEHVSNTCVPSGSQGPLLPLLPLPQFNRVDQLTPLCCLCPLLLPFCVPLSPTHDQNISVSGPFTLTSLCVIFSHSIHVAATSQDFVHS